jgi:class 3 adenylate cyclase
MFAHEWGTGRTLELYAPHLAGNPEIKAWWARFERAAASPGTARQYAQLALEADTRGVLPGVRARTLVIHRSRDPLVPEWESREVADLIPEARFVSLEGQGTYPWMDDTGPLLDELAEFLTGHAAAPVPDTVLTTVLFTDIVGSTEAAQRLGDEAWNELLESHDDAIRRQVRRFDGRQVKDLGDGFMVTFDGPARALRCARACVEAARSVGVTIRTGLHIGECLRRGDDLGGVAVHVAARVSGLAEGGEVLCSSVVKDLVIGSGLAFEDRGEHALKGVEGSWRLYALSGGGG